MEEFLLDLVMGVAFSGVYSVGIVGSLYYVVADKRDANERLRGMRKIIIIVTILIFIGIVALLAKEM
jgi:hypothetical protein